jgi:hypothetical protein
MWLECLTPSLLICFFEFDEVGGLGWGKKGCGFVGDNTKKE